MKCFKLIFLLSFIVFVLLVNVATVSMQVINIEHGLTTEHPWHKGCQFIKEQLEGRSNGELKVNIYDSYSLSQGSWSILLEQLEKNIVQMAPQSTIPYATQVEELFAFNTPFLFDDMDHVMRFMAQKPPVVDKWFSKLENKGLKVVGIWPRPCRQLINSKRPIRTPEDIKGLRFRVPELNLFVKTFEAMGAKPVPLASGEIYTAIQLGTVVGEDNSAGTIFDAKSYEVTKYMSKWNYMADLILVTVNKEWFESLPEKYQTLINEVTQEAAEVVYKESVKQEEYAMKVFEEKGIEFTYFTDEMKKSFKDLMTPIYDYLKSTIGEDDWKEFLSFVEKARVKGPYGF
ncbi:MAG: TRAP transporter substrate-binding protein [Actinobacteria bacterium]|nr:TRAP transporter substrate-binding protein [Actinomycetota bacterium]